MSADPRLGATATQGGTGFRVWAPDTRRAAVQLEGRDHQVVLESCLGGYHGAHVPGVGPGDRYRFVLDDADPMPDPASRWQPEGPHGPSAVVDRGFAWTDDGWRGRPLGELVLYEVHVGCFTPEGTFDAMIPELDRLVDLGVTALELMPVAEFPGTRNWGYDGVFPSAAHHAYGGPDGLRRLVDACHRVGLAVVLDVVYNHLGPEGNVLGSYGPYFTDRYRTPWGDALNFDGPGSDDVRAYFVDSARWWLEDLHVDGLRLDAVHAIVDPTAYGFVEELADAAHRIGRHLDRHILVIAESDANDPRLVRAKQQGGMGLDGVWNDDFHHALHTTLTDEHDGYYRDYDGIADVARAYRGGFVFDGGYSLTRRRRHGRPLDGVPAQRLVVAAQNHDQVGNRMLGERLSTLVDHDRLRVAAAATLLAPFTPLIFMGEEYGELAPFQYFVSHTDPDLVEAVRRGRAQEFAHFDWSGRPPDPQAPETFERSTLDPARRDEPAHRELEGLYRALLSLRRSLPSIVGDHAVTEVHEHREHDTVVVHRRPVRRHGADVALVLHLGNGSVRAPVQLAGGSWWPLLDTARFPSPPDDDVIACMDSLCTVRLAPWSAILAHRSPSVSLQHGDGKG
jgi:maltooligosyltrehalose trehalohydrolase